MYMFCSLLGDALQCSSRSIHRNGSRTTVTEPITLWMLAYTYWTFSLICILLSVYQRICKNVDTCQMIYNQFYYIVHCINTTHTVISTTGITNWHWTLCFHITVTLLKLFTQLTQPWINIYTNTSALRLCASLCTYVYYTDTEECHTHGRNVWIYVKYIHILYSKING